MKRSIEGSICKSNILQATILVFLFSSWTFGQEIGWIKLIPLESTREDVEKILGAPEQSFETYALYVTGAGEFSVWYSAGNCLGMKPGERWWKAPKGRLTTLLYRPKQPLSKRAYISDQLKREKWSFPGPGERYIYTLNTKEQSITYTTSVYANDSELIEAIEIEPTADKEFLRCKQTK